MSELNEEKESSIDYHLAVSWLFRQFASYQQLGKSAYKPDLGNILHLIEVLDLNLGLSALKFVHIAGTNGKGSCVNYIGSVLIESGYTTGIFTSPHIVDFRERIVVNGEQVDEDFVVGFCENIKNLDFTPSFFEITFAMALSFFIQSKCEYVVLETGLGGRLDATNVVTPILSIITNIGMDHMELLGDTLPKIAYEKAGIIKAKVPIIIGEYNADTFPIFEQKAMEMHSPLLLVDQNAELAHPHFIPSSYMNTNEKVILKSLEELKSLGLTKINENSVEAGFKNIHINTSYRARFETISDDPYEIIDVSHNPAGMSAFMDSISKLKYQQLHILYGSSADKNYVACAQLFPKDALVYFAQFSNERSLTAEKAKKDLSNLGLQISFHKNVFHAYKELMTHRHRGDLTIVVGSFFLITDYLAFKE